MGDLTLRHMRGADVSPVVEIDRLSFDPAWPASSYYFEVNKSTCSHMVVLERASENGIGMSRWWANLRGQRRAIEIIGYGGLWRIQEEAHISTIAVHPDARGQGYGELMLAAMLCRALRLGAVYCVLEVRVSNTVAQALYKKYHFDVHGVKKKYYQNQEDAYDMRLQFSNESAAFLHAQYDVLCQRFGFRDQYSTTPHPRLG